MYKLKTTSTSARFYSWIWKTNITKFKNMCPYFWKYVLTIIFLPLILIGKLILYLIPTKKQFSNSRLEKIINKISEPNRFWDIIGKILKWMFFAVVGIAILIIIVALCIKFYQNLLIGLAIIGCISICLVIILLIFYLNDEHNLGSRIAYPFKLFGNMVYCLYKNICPLINWEKL